MTEGKTREVFTSQVMRLLEGGDFTEVLLLSSPVRYRLDKHRHETRARLEEARQNGQALQVVVDWESQEILGVLP